VYELYGLTAEEVRVVVVVFGDEVEVVDDGHGSLQARMQCRTPNVGFLQRIQPLDEGEAFLTKGSQDGVNGIMNV